MGFSLNKRVLREQMLSLVSAPHPSPLFVFGNQKSGTSAIAGLLAASSGQRLIADFAGAREPYIGRLLRGETSIADYVSANAWAFSAPIVKEPSLTFVAAQLMEHFALRRAVFIIRDPWANIRSILNRLELRGDTEFPVQSANRKINRNWQSILRGQDLGLEPSHFVTNLARRWLRAVEICEKLENRAAVVRYEDFNRRKIPVIGELAGNLNLPIRNNIAALADHQFQPRGQSVDLAEFFGPNLKRINDICAEIAWRYGYETPSRFARAEPAPYAA